MHEDASNADTAEIEIWPESRSVFHRLYDFESGIYLISLAKTRLLCSLSHGVGVGIREHETFNTVSDP